MNEAIVIWLLKLSVTQVFKGLARKVSESTPLQDAVRKTAAEFSQYENVEGTLNSWWSENEVQSVFDGLCDGQLPDAATATGLVDGFSRAGFYVAEGQKEAATKVLSRFFEILLDESINSPSGGALATRLIRTDIRDVGADVRSLREEVIRALSPPQAIALPLPKPSTEPDEAPYDAAETTLREGKAKQVLHWLDIQELVTPPTPHIRYRRLALRGHALLQLGELSVSEQLFRNALALEPGRPNALSNLAQALILQERLEEADPYVREALLLEADHDTSLKLMVQIATDREGIDAGLTYVHRLKSEIDRRLFAGLAYKIAGNIPRAIVELREALELDPAQFRTAQNLAEALMIEIQAEVTEKGAGPWGMMPGDLQAKMEEADRLFTQTLEALDRRDDLQECGRTRLNRGTVRHFLGRPDAEEDITAAVACGFLTAESARAIVVFYLSVEQPEAALKTLEAVQSKGVAAPDLQVLYGQVLTEAGKPGDALIVLNAIVESPDGATRRTGCLARSDALIALKRYDEAREALAELGSEASTDWDVALQRARCAEGEGKKEVGLEILQDAVRRPQKGNEWRLHILIARQLAHQRRWADAADEYGIAITPAAPTTLVREFAGCLLNAQRIKECLALCTEFRRQKGFQSETVEIEVRAYQALNDLTKADTLLAELEAAETGNPRWGLKRATIAMRQGRWPDVGKHIDGLEAKDGFLASEIMMLAQLNLAIGDRRKALEIAYRAASEHPEEPDVQLKYIGVFTAVSPHLKDLLSPVIVEKGTVVTLEDDGERRVWDTESTSELTDRLLGHKATEVVLLSEDSFGEHSVTIVEIRSKYVALFQDIGQTFNTRFPSQSGFRRVRFDENDSSAFLKSIDQRADAIEAAKNFYRTNPFPIVLVRRMVGLSYAEMWYGAINGMLGERIMVAPPSPDQQSKLLEVAGASTPLVLDLTSAIFAAELGLLDVLSGLGRRLLIPQSLLDELEDARLHRDPLFGVATMTVGKLDGQYVRQAHDEAEAKKAEVFIRGIMEWLRQHCQILPLTPEQATEATKLDKAFESSAGDCILLARQHAAAFLSEDGRLRGFASTEYSVDGTALPFILIKASERGLCSPQLMAMACARMLAAGYFAIPITPEILEEAWELDKHDVGPILRKVLQILADPALVTNAAAQLLASILRIARRSTPISPAAEQKVVFSVFATLARRAEWLASRRLFLAHLEVAFGLDYFGFQAIRSQFETWCRARGLP